MILYSQHGAPIIKPLRSGRCNGRGEGGDIAIEIPGQIDERTVILDAEQRRHVGVTPYVADAGCVETASWVIGGAAPQT